ncbi:Methylenetetrahydrofolate dehydrogenase (NADP+) [Clostridiaceae bacterium JG1575]|nr:Methylenetetrahydrofolate dehydrogenase (NADP+) [Clostridiaceae bacterium JG1575]
MGNIINVKELAAKYKESIKAFATEREVQKKSIPTLATVLVGSDEGSQYYLDSQTRVAKSLNLGKVNITLPQEATQEEVLTVVDELNADPNVHGIMVLFPLPAHLDAKEVSSRIAVQKDIDGVNPINAGRLFMGDKAFVPCTAKSAHTIIKEVLGDIKGKSVVIVGRSNIVGKPLAMLLLADHATVTIAHSRTKNLQEVTRAADIVVAAVGRPEMFTKEYFSPGQTVIDVGTSEKDGKITGDVKTDEVAEVVAHITSVPCGVGAITTTLLMQSVCEASKA